MTHDCEREPADEPLISGSETDEIESASLYRIKGGRAWLPKCSIFVCVGIILPWAIVMALSICLSLQYQILKSSLHRTMPNLYSMYPHCLIILKPTKSCPRSCREWGGIYNQAISIGFQRWLFRISRHALTRNWREVVSTLWQYGSIPSLESCSLTGSW